MQTVNPELHIHLNPVNPGQFFACCGLLELADRAWKGAVGWFEENEFKLAPADSGPAEVDILATLAQCELKNTMTDTQVARYEELTSTKPGEKFSSAEKTQRNEEKKQFRKLRRELPLILGSPFDLELNWFLDSRSGGSRFKTWAGQQSVLDIAEKMKQPLAAGAYAEVDPAGCLQHSCGSEVTFNFDADASTQGSALDAGFSLDPLGMTSGSRPLLELLAFIGLQRFRPAAEPKNNAYTYTLWRRPLLPPAAKVAVSGECCVPGEPRFVFPLLYRTKYLKSFLPANPIS